VRQGVEVEDVALDEVVASRVDLPCLEDEVGLFDVHRAAVYAEDELSAEVEHLQRPEARVTAEVEYPLAREGAAARGLEQRRDHVVAPLAVAVHPCRIMDGRSKALELDLVMPAGERGDPLREIRAVHVPVAPVPP
jgi:hypothetical protein